MVHNLGTREKTTFFEFEIVYWRRMSYYPQIDPRALTALTSIKQMLESNQDYLENPDCPYDEGLRKQLQLMLEPKVIEVPVEKIVERIVERKVEIAAAASEGGKRGPKAKGSSSNANIIQKELQGITEDLRQLKLNSKTLMPADKVQILKTQAALVEKMIVMEERTSNIKVVSRFMSTVMGILDDILDDEQRQTVMKRLEPFANEE